MADLKKNDYKRIENYLKSSMDEPQWESNVRAIQNFETKMDEMHAQSRRNERKARRPSTEPTRPTA